MEILTVRPVGKNERLDVRDQLAWRIAEVAAERITIDPDAEAMAIDRIIDNAAVATAALGTRAVCVARDQALAHRSPVGATLLGMPNDVKVHAEWAAWANATAVRALDFNDYFADLESAHPGDNIPAILSVAEQCRSDGASVLRGIVMAYEIHISLAKGIELKRHGFDHVCHAGPAVAAGIGAMLGLEVEVIYEAVQQAALLSQASRQTRRGDMTSWKSFAPGHTGKIAIEAVDRAMRGERSPTPIYEGEDGIINRLAGGEACEVPLAGRGEPRRQILETFGKQHAIAYHGQAIIDLAIRMRPMVADAGSIASVVLQTKRNTHTIMGNGSNDPQKYDPGASHETLDHSAMYAFAVALQDGCWHHVDSYRPERARRPDTVDLWRKIRTEETEEWNRRFDGLPPLARDHGLRAVITFQDGGQMSAEMAVPSAHPRGDAPFARGGYIEKFERLSAGIVSLAEARRFLCRAVQLPVLRGDEIGGLNVVAEPDRMPAPVGGRGIFPPL